MSTPPWRLSLQPASYNGVPFHVDVGNRGGGRRKVPHEFPKRNIPYLEDMGRRIRKWTVNAYMIYSPVLSPNWEADRDALLTELESETDGLLVLPTGMQWMDDGPTGMVGVDTYSLTERRERGGWCEFEIVFLEAGQSPSSQSTADTQGLATSSADSAATQFQSSSDISGGGYSSGNASYGTGGTVSASNNPDFPGSP